ncbi:MAG: 23S rRNA (guanosine(2251)-2'-O)-methyltransferase RlmB [Candidatus Sericytochromatia bacterium]
MFNRKDNNKDNSKKRSTTKKEGFKSKDSFKPKDSKKSFKSDFADKKRTGKPSKEEFSDKKRAGKPSKEEFSDRKRSPKTLKDAPKRGRKEDFKTKKFETKGKFSKEEFLEDSNQAREFVYGRHPISEILESNTQINKVWIDENFKDTIGLFDKIKQTNIPYQVVAKAKLSNLVGEVNHQGVVASISEKEYTEFYDLLELAKTKEVFFVILDKVEDPHNLGAIIRTADATGVDAIIIPKHGAVGITGVVSKTSAGSLSRMNICRVTNLAQTIDKLKEHNIWVAGVDMNGKDVYTQCNFKGNVAVVLGGEGKGISSSILKSCDFSVKIPMKEHSNSLNVSVATAVVCYEVFKQKDFK